MYYSYVLPSFPESKTTCYTLYKLVHLPSGECIINRDHINVPLENSVRADPV